MRIAQLFVADTLTYLGTISNNKLIPDALCNDEILFQVPAFAYHRHYATVRN